MQWANLEHVEMASSPELSAPSAVTPYPKFKCKLKGVVVIVLTVADGLQSWRSVLFFTSAIVTSLILLQTTWTKPSADGGAAPPAQAFSKVQHVPLMLRKLLFLQSTSNESLSRSRHH